MTSGTATVRCRECRGTGREVEIDEQVDDFGDVIAEIPRDYGPCEICEGRGWLPADPADAAREQRRADHRQALDEHLRGGVHSCTRCPPGCPVELQLYRDHRRPGGVHDTHCRDGCIGY